MLVTYKCDFETEIEETCFLVESTDDDYDFTREMVQCTIPNNMLVGLLIK